MLAIIGAGTTGIACGIEAVKMGIKDICIFEKGSEHSNTIRKFYKDGKRVDKSYKGQDCDLLGNVDFVDGTKESTLELFDKLIEQNNLNIKYNSEVESIKNNGEYFDIYTNQQECFRAKFVIVCIGKMGQPNKPSYAIPLPIRGIVNFNANSHKDGEKTLIVGGGNSAVEYACSISKTSPTMLNYRRDSFTRINDQNRIDLDEAINSGKLKTKLGVDITAIHNEDSKAKVEFSNGEFEVFDRIIYAIGGATPIDFLKKCNLELNDQSTPITDQNLESSIKNMFVAGDIALDSGGSIVTGLNHAYKILKEIQSRI